MKKSELQERAGLASSIITKLNNDRSVTTNTLIKICTALDCRVEDIMEITPDKKEDE
jgi:DNA-binding Xre family transcriptional regulator